MRKLKHPSSIRQRQRDAAMDTVLGAAEAAIARKGYDNATMHDIAAAAGCATGTLYLYFKSKEELVGAIVARHSRVLTRQLYEAMAGTENPVEKLRRNTQAFLDYFNAHKTFFNLFYSATTAPLGANLQSRLRDSALKNYLEFRQIELDLVRQAQARGLMRTDLAPEVLLNFMHGVALGVLSQWSAAAVIPPPAEQMRLLWGLQTGGAGVADAARP